MDKKPVTEYSDKYHVTYWENEFRSFKAFCYVPDNELDDGVLNFGFTAPYIMQVERLMQYITALHFK